MTKRKPVYRNPLLCLLIYVLCILGLLLWPLPLWIELPVFAALSVLAGLAWHLNFRHLNAHREELRTVANTVEDAMWSMKPNGTIEWMNPAFCAIFHTSEEQRYRPYGQVIACPAVLDFVREFMVRREDRMSEVTLEDHSFLLTGSYNQDAERFVFIMQDIDIIRQTEKMKKDFLVNVAHELRTPLTAIKGFTLALEEDFVPANKRFLKIIKNHTERLIKLISDLQILARLERLPALDLQRIDLMVFMENILGLYHHTLEQEGLKLDYKQDPADIKVRVDPFKFEQIFINLIDNALHYTGRGGISIAAALEGKNLLVTVADTGSGISPEHLPRIFERFYVAEPSRNKKISGTGLGLAIVKHAVRLHNGTISVSSRPGRGTVFTLLFSGIAEP